MKETVDFSKLISNAINGDDSAFEELYRLTHKTAYHTASVLLKNPDDVEDVLQNSYIKAYKKLPELKSPESFDCWIKTIVENECKNYIKKEKRIHTPIVFLKNKVEECTEEWNKPAPQEYMEREELRKSVSDILDALSPEIRACIVLFHYEQKSLNEISEMLDIPLGTVKSRLHNGRKQIEKEFNKLKKKDPSLYSIGAIPAILSLLLYQSENIVVPAAISESVLTSAAAISVSGATASAGGAAAGTAVTAASTAAGSAATTTAASIALKITAVAVAGTVAVGGTVVVKKHIESKSAETTTAYSTTQKVEESCTVAEITTELQTQAITLSAVSLTEKSNSTTSTQISTTQFREITTENYSTTTVKQTTNAKTTTSATKTTTKPATTKTVATTVPAATEPQTTSPENNYGASGGVITGYTGDDTYVTIPSSVGGNTVTAIGSGAFSGNTSIRSVSLPSTITQIGQEAFADCTSLSSVSLPSSLELIGIGAFYGCSNLTSVSIPDGTKTISDEAFAQCSSLNSITIPTSVTSIADDAFDGCGSLTIRCEEGSAAHNFAVENNINFILL